VLLFLYREEMLRLDELNREMAAKRALVGFVALQPRFPPTFKVSDTPDYIYRTMINFDSGTPLLTMSSSSAAYSPEVDMEARGLPQPSGERPGSCPVSTAESVRSAHGRRKR
jgi:hypothetical protein